MSADAAPAFRSRAPQRLPALLWSIIFALLGLMGVFAGDWKGWLLAACCGLFVLVSALAVFAPRWFLHGVRHMPDGFEFRSPLRAIRTVRFDEIRHIKAVSMRDGDMGLPWVDLIVSTRRTSMRLHEHMLVESGLLAALQAMPGFDGQAYDSAVQHEPNELREPFGKRFIVFDRR